MSESTSKVKQDAENLLQERNKMQEELEASKLEIRKMESEYKEKVQSIQDANDKQIHELNDKIVSL